MWFTKCNRHRAETFGIKQVPRRGKKKAYRPFYRVERVKQKKTFRICPDHILSQRSCWQFYERKKHGKVSSRNTKRSWRHIRKMPSYGAFQCTTWLVWNKLAASKSVLWFGCRGLLGRVVIANYTALSSSQHKQNRLKSVVQQSKIFQFNYGELWDPISILRHFN